MGSKVGCGYACLVVVQFEQMVFSSFTGKFPYLFKRYIDDILGIMCGSREELEQFITYVAVFQVHLGNLH